MDRPHPVWNVGMATEVNGIPDVKVWFRQLRIHQWSKNLLLLVPMLAAHWYFVQLGKPVSPNEIDLAVTLCGGAAFLGHMYSIYLKFGGGKGVATGLGVFVVLEPLAALISLFLFIAVVYFSGYVAVGSLMVSALITLWIWLLKGSPNHVFLAFFIGVLIWIKHADNIKRLFDGTETNWRAWKKNKDADQ